MGSDDGAFEVRCPGVGEPVRVSFRYCAPEGRPRGLLVLLSGGDGTRWWGQDHPLVPPVLAGLAAEGVGWASLRWARGWLQAAEGEAAGPARLACRPATAIRWIHDRFYLPLGLAPGGDTGGFVVTGNSGGASQACYALSHHGLGELVDLVVPTSGPPHAGLAKACLRRPGEQRYWYEPDGAAAVIDRSYGFTGGGGPCAAHDPSFTRAWERDSVDAETADHHHPSTRVHLILGDQDRDPPDARPRR